MAPLIAGRAAVVAVENIFLSPWYSTMKYLTNKISLKVTATAVQIGKKMNAIFIDTKMLRKRFLGPCIVQVKLDLLNSILAQ